MIPFLLTSSFANSVIKGVSYISKLPPIQKLRLVIRNRIIGIIGLKDKFEDLKYNDFINLFSIIFILDKEYQKIKDIDIETIKLIYLNIIKEINENIETNNNYVKKITKNGINQSNKTKKLISLFSNNTQLSKIFPENDPNTNNFIIYLLNEHFDYFYVLVNIDVNKFIYITIKIMGENEIIRKFTYEQLKNNLDKINLLIQPCSKNIIEKDQIYYNNVLNFYINFYQNKLCNNFILTQVNNELQISTLIESEDYKKPIYNFQKILDNINIYTSNYYLKMLYSFNTETFDFDSKSSLKGGGFSSFMTSTKTKNNTIKPVMNRFRVDLIKSILFNYKGKNNYDNLYKEFIQNNNIENKGRFTAISLNYDLQSTSLYIGLMNEINYNLEDIDKLINFEKKILDETHVSQNNSKKIHERAYSYGIIVAEKILSKVRNKELTTGGASQNNTSIVTINNKAINTSIATLNNKEINTGIIEKNNKGINNSIVTINNKNTSNIVFDRILINMKKDINSLFISDFVIKNKLESLINSVHLSTTDFNPDYLKTMKGFNNEFIIHNCIKKIYFYNENFDNVHSKLEITFTLNKNDQQINEYLDINEGLYFQCRYVNEINFKNILISKIEDKIKSLILFNIREFNNYFIKYLNRYTELSDFFKKLLKEGLIVQLVVGPNNIQLYILDKNKNKIEYMDAFYLTILFSFPETNDSIYYNINNRNFIVKLRELNKTLKQDLFTQNNDIFNIISNKRKELKNNILDCYDKIINDQKLNQIEIIAKGNMIDLNLKKKDDINVQNLIFYLNIYNRNIYYFIDYLTNHRTYSKINIYLTRNSENSKISGIDNFLIVKIIKTEITKTICNINLELLSIILYDEFRITFAVLDVLIKIIKNKQSYFINSKKNSSNNDLTYNMDTINKLITVTKFLMVKIPTNKYIKNIKNVQLKKNTQSKKNKYKKNLNSALKNSFVENKQINNKFKKIIVKMNNNTKKNITNLL